MTKREIAESAIRNAIETGLYKPGQVISQRQIGEDLGLSVTPIREAIIELCSNGVVARHSHHSIKVTEIDGDKLADIFRVRHLLEEEAMALAVEHIQPEDIERLKKLNGKLAAIKDFAETSEINKLDKEFHRIVFSACQNEALLWSIDRVNLSFPMYALWREPGRIETSIAEHDEIIASLEAKDVERSIAAQRQHLSDDLKATIGYVQTMTI